jgi:hypothetical protein
MISGKGSTSAAVAPATYSFGENPEHAPGLLAAEHVPSQQILRDVQIGRYDTPAPTQTTFGEAV